jgi:hypothetical protein
MVNVPQKGNGAANVFLCHVYGEPLKDHISVGRSSEVW